MKRKTFIIFGIIILVVLVFIIVKTSMKTKQITSAYYFVQDLNKEGISGEKVILHLSGITGAINVKINEVLMNFAQDYIQNAISEGCTGKVNGVKNICCGNILSSSNYESTPTSETNNIQIDEYSTYWYPNNTLKTGINNPHPQVYTILRKAFENMTSTTGISDLQNRLKNEISNIIVSNGGTVSNIDVQIKYSGMRGAIFGRKEYTYYAIYKRTGSKSGKYNNNCNNVYKLLPYKCNIPRNDPTALAQHPECVWMNITAAGCRFINVPINKTEIIQGEKHCYDSNMVEINCDEVGLSSKQIGRKTTLLLNHHITVTATYTLNTTIKGIVMYKAINQGIIDVDVSAVYVYNGVTYTDNFYKRLIIEPMYVQNTDEVASKNLGGTTRLTYEIREYGKITVDDDRLLPDNNQMYPNPTTETITSIYYTEEEITGSGQNTIYTNRMYGGGVCLS